MSGSVSAQDLPAYTAITANDGKRVILPVGAAGRSRLLHDLLEGLHVMHMAMASKLREGDHGEVQVGEQGNSHATEAKGSASVELAHQHTDLYTALIEAEQQQQQQRAGAGALHNSSFADGGQESFTCYARAYPTFRRVSSTTSEAAAAEEHECWNGQPSPLLEVPLGCVEGETMARIAEFLVQKACAAVEPQGAGGSHKVDPLRDLDCTSQTDQLTAIRLLLGSDLLGC